jgi:hypothetical protein
VLTAKHWWERVLELEEKRNKIMKPNSQPAHVPPDGLGSAEYAESYPTEGDFQERKADTEVGENL